jgi:hypothetical protein
VNVKNFLKLLKTSAGDSNLPPINFFISKINTIGEAQEQTVQLSFSFEVRKIAICKIFDDDSLGHFVEKQMDPSGSPSGHCCSYFEQCGFCIKYSTD